MARLTYRLGKVVLYTRSDINGNVVDKVIGVLALKCPAQKLIYSAIGKRQTVNPYFSIIIKYVLSLKPTTSFG